MKDFLFYNSIPIIPEFFDCTAPIEATNTLSVQAHPVLEMQVRGIQKDKKQRNLRGLQWEMVMFFFFLKLILPWNLTYRLKIKYWLEDGIHFFFEMVPFQVTCIFSGGLKVFVKICF